MTIATWPAAMRQAGGAGVTGSPQSNISSFTPDIGPSIDRRRATSFTSIYDVDMPLLNATEYSAFRTFFHDTLKDGTLPFSWNHPFTGVLMRCKFYNRDGSTYEETKITSLLVSLRFRVQFISVIPA